MKIAVIGTGYVGLVSGTCFAEVGNTVTCVDVNEDKIEKLKQGIIPIYEPGLETMVLNNIANKNLLFTTDIAQAIKQVEIVFIAVGTPMGEDGSADLQYVLSVAQSIGEAMENHLIIVNKSTVPIGTADKVKEVIHNVLEKRRVKSFHFFKSISTFSSYNYSIWLHKILNCFSFFKKFRIRYNIKINREFSFF